MGLKVHLAPQVIADLDEIRTYLLPRNRLGAERVRLSIERTINALAEMPRIGHRSHIPGVYSAPVKRYPYVVYYAATDSELTILHIRHGARDVPADDEF